MKERGPWARTASGKRFYVLDPQPEDIDVYDIAVGLAFQCRFNGQTRHFYSIAQHSVLVSQREWWGADHIAALFHNAAEAYMGDWISPLKHAIGRKLYERYEKPINEAIERKVGFLTEPAKFDVKEADWRAYCTEARDLQGYEFSQQEWEFTWMPWPDRIKPWSPEKSLRMFLRRCRELGVEYVIPRSAPWQHRITDWIDRRLDTLRTRRTKWWLYKHKSSTGEL